MSPRLSKVFLGGAALLATLLPLASSAVEDAPFVPTPDEVVTAMLELAKVGPRDHVIDLGSGDGRIVIEAARRYGASGLGVEKSHSLSFHQEPDDLLLCEPLLHASASLTHESLRSIVIYP